jgi:hypothetical protein
MSHHQGRNSEPVSEQTESMSSSSGTVSTTAYTSTDGSHLSWISMDAAALHSEEMEKSRKETEKTKMKPVKSLVMEFFGAPSGSDMRVLERWLTELGVGWVLHLAEGKVQQTPDASSWFRALTEIMGTISLIAESDEEQAQFASFTQQALLKLLAFVDFTDAFSLAWEDLISNNWVSWRTARPYDKLLALLHVRDTLSKAPSKIPLSLVSSRSAEVNRIVGDIVSVLSAKESKVGEAIWTEMEEIRARIVLESMEDAQESCRTQTPQEALDIDRASISVTAYVRVLLIKDHALYLLVAQSVSEAASRGKYVPQIGDGLPLWSLVVEMISCVLEKLADKSEAFRDHSLRFLFLLINSSFIRDELCEIHHLPESYKSAFISGKVDGYVDNYMQISWAPVLACLLNPKPLRLFRKTNSPLLKFESEFHKTFTTQKLWKVPDPKLRKTLRGAIIEKIVPDYTKYIEDNKVTTPRFTPGDVQEMLQELFEG